MLKSGRKNTILKASSPGELESRYLKEALKRSRSFYAGYFA
jgi:hypothetical protein